MPRAGLPEQWSRTVIIDVLPEVDCGRYPVKRSRGQSIDILAHVVVDGHELAAVELHFGRGDGPEQTVRMLPQGNDEYLASFTLDALGFWHYRVTAWLDRFATWQDLYKRRVKGGEVEKELKAELLEGAALLERAVLQASGDDLARLQKFIAAFRKGDIEAALKPEVLALAQGNDPREGAVDSAVREVLVDHELAVNGSWYEFFPRSAGTEPGRHGTLDDAAERLPHIARMGFDIVYLPPVHPIGEQFRKGKDNAPTARPEEPGSPWAIGAREGGHKAVHPELGGIEAFDRFVSKAESLGLKVALDIAYQTSPDHPYVKDHPEWFQHRPDGTIRYAENPPKKYQDVYPLDFESENWQELWEELRDVFRFWIDHGVTIFRVDNPHTKPYAFWEWCIGTLRAEHPEIIFLAEAFTRPKVMYLLAKLGFNQSYTYFTWRNTKEEVTAYFEELYQTEVREFFRPNLWPNTPDILHAYLQYGGRPAHMARLVLASTLSSAYGLYGPPYEHVVHEAHPEREEYANNEKYEIRTWDWGSPQSLAPLISRLNRIRKENPALQEMWNLKFLFTDNPEIIAYTKETGDNLLLIAVNLDPHFVHEGWIHLPLKELDLPAHEPFVLHDLVSEERFFWHGERNFVRLNPQEFPAHVFRIHRHVRREQDFDYYL